MNNITAILGALVVCGLAFMLIFGADLIEGFVAGKQAELSAARADEALAKAQLVGAQAAAFAWRADVAQTWLVYVVLIGLVVVLVVGVALVEAWRLRQTEAMLHAMAGRQWRAVDPAIIANVNRELSTAQVIPADLLPIEKLRGEMSRYERMVGK